MAAIQIPKNQKSPRTGQPQCRNLQGRVRVCSTSSSANLCSNMDGFIVKIQKKGAQIFILRNIIEQCTEWQRHLHINFMDFKKAYDSIHEESLWRILRARNSTTDCPCHQEFQQQLKVQSGNGKSGLGVKDWC